MCVLKQKLSETAVILSIIIFYGNITNVTTITNMLQKPFPELFKICKYMDFLHLV